MLSLFPRENVFPSHLNYTTSFHLVLYSPSALVSIHRRNLRTFIYLARALLDTATPSRTFPSIHYPLPRVIPFPRLFLSSVAPFSQPIMFSLSPTASSHHQSS